MTGRPTPEAPAAAAAEAQRLDKWLWCARFFKSRALAAAACNDGRIRVSGRAAARPSQPVRRGDVLTFPAGPHIRTVRVVALAGRRGPAAEARGLYVDLTAARHSPATAEGAETPRD